MQPTDQHTLRVQNELQKVGISSSGRTKFAAKLLPGIILPDEHILSAVYGYGQPTHKWLAFETAMLIATDRRIIVIEHELGSNTTDEFSYDIVSGVKLDKTRMFTNVTLHAAVGNVVIKNTNPDHAENFVHFIEQKRLKKLPST